MRLYNKMLRAYWEGFDSEIEQARPRGPAIPRAPRTLTPRETETLRAELWGVDVDAEKTLRIRLHLSEHNKDVTCQELVKLFGSYRSESEAGELIASVWDRIIDSAADHAPDVLSQGSDVILDVVEELR